VAEEKVQVKLPDGVSAAEFEKLFATWQKQRVSTKERDAAVRAATKDLIAKYKTEYDALLAKYTPK